MIKMYSLFLSMVLLFSISLSAASSAEKVFSFENDTLTNFKKLEKACQFCQNNRQNIFILVDDSLFHRMALKQIALQIGRAVFEFKSGDALLEALRNNDIASVLVPNARVVVLDNHMPGTLGVEVMAIIKRDRLLKGREIPVVLNTDNLADIDESLINNFTKICPRKNSKEVIEEADRENNLPHSSRTINYHKPQRISLAKL